MSRIDLRWCLFLLVWCVGGGLTVGRAAEVRSGDDVVIKADEVIDDDLYVFGRHIIIDGTVNGDVVAFGEQITVNGVVKGHVMGAGQTVVLLGQSDGARIAGQVLKIGPKASLDGDVLAAGLSLECAKESTIAGDALFAGYQALFAGKISHDVRGGMANCRLEGQVGGDVNVEVGSNKDNVPPSAFGPPPPVAMPNVPGGLTIAEWAEVEGDLTYSAPQEANIDANAKIHGEMDYRPPTPKKAGAAPAAHANRLVTKAIAQLRHVVSVLIVGLIALLVMPRWTTTWAETVRSRPAASLMGGVAGFVAFLALLVVVVVIIVLVSILFGMFTLGELVPMVIVGGIVGMRE